MRLRSRSWIAAPVTGLNDVTAIAAGFAFGVALQSTGGVLSWGNNEFGQLGRGPIPNRRQPGPVAALGGIRAIAAGGEHAVALRSDGTLLAWGGNRLIRGQKRP